MQKLEEILHAEETSRRAVDDARTRARELLKEARSEAALIAVEADRELTKQATALRGAALRDAGAEAAVIEHEAEAELDRVVRHAESRYAAAVDAVTDVLAG
jgi:vacuolar-type H+-ATPase subunit H